MENENINLPEEGITSSEEPHSRWHLFLFIAILIVIWFSSGKLHFVVRNEMRNAVSWNNARYDAVSSHFIFEPIYISVATDSYGQSINGYNTSIEPFSAFSKSIISWLVLSPIGIWSFIYNSFLTCEELGCIIMIPLWGLLVAVIALVTALVFRYFLKLYRENNFKKFFFIFLSFYFLYVTAGLFYEYNVTYRPLALLKSMENYTFDQNMIDGYHIDEKTTIELDNDDFSYKAGNLLQPLCAWLRFEITSDYDRADHVLVDIYKGNCDFKNSKIYYNKDIIYTAPKTEQQAWRTDWARSDTKERVAVKFFGSKFTNLFNNNQGGVGSNNLNADSYRIIKMISAAISPLQSSNLSANTPSSHSESESLSANVSEKHTEKLFTYMQPNGKVEVNGDLLALPSGESQEYVLTEGNGGKPTYVWIPTNVPAKAKYLIFEFSQQNQGNGEFMNIGINDDLYYQLELEFFKKDGSADITDPMDISKYAGKNIKIFIGLIANGDNHAKITVGNIKFICENPYTCKP